MSEDPLTDPSAAPEMTGLPPLAVDDIDQQANDAARNMVDSAPDAPEDQSNPEQHILDKAEWHKKYDEAHDHAVKEKLPFTVLIMDLDRFKAVNDDLGHAVGDEVIAKTKGLVAELAGSLRINDKPTPEHPNDIVSITEFKDDPTAEGGHYGGDEFTLYSFTDSEGAKVVMERMRELFNKYVELPENKALKDIGLSLSIGIATQEAGAQEPKTNSELLAEADEGMYDDKLNNLPELTHEQWEALHQIDALLGKAGVRKRDLHNYDKLAAILHQLNDTA